MINIDKGCAKLKGNQAQGYTKGISQYRKGKGGKNQALIGKRRNNTEFLFLTTTNVVETL